MGPNSFGLFFRVTTFGESHGMALGVVIDGVRPNIPFDIEGIQAVVNRRRPGASPVTTSRQEEDLVEVLSGVFDGRTTGAPLAMLVRNQDARPEAYEELKDLFRPGHADFTVLAKYGIRDHRGGGRLSGRETVGRVAAGAFARQLLRSRGVSVFSWVNEIGGIRADPVKVEEALRLPEEKLDEVIHTFPVPCPDAKAAKDMEELILSVAGKGDSLGGVVEILARGVPPGWGDPVFWKLDAELGGALLSIGGVKAVEIGDGFELARSRGSASNDEMDEGGFVSNHSGGTLGGISSGQPIRIRIGVKPTPSISVPQQTLDMLGRKREMSIKGRHDPCLAPRITSVAEAMTSLVLVEAMLRQDALNGKASGPGDPEMAAFLSELMLLDAAARRIKLCRLRPFEDSGKRRDLFLQEASLLGLPSDWAKALWDHLSKA